MRKFIAAVLLFIASPAIADDLMPPTLPNEWPMTRVRCTNIDFDPADTQPSSQSCVQVWFNDSEKCYYLAQVELDGIWRVRSKTLMRLEFTGEARCTPQTHLIMTQPKKSRNLAPR